MLDNRNSVFEICLTQVLLTMYIADPWPFSCVLTHANKTQSPLSWKEQTLSSFFKSLFPLPSKIWERSEASSSEIAWPAYLDGYSESSVPEPALNGYVRPSMQREKTRWPSFSTGDASLRRELDHSARQNLGRVTCQSDRIWFMVRLRLCRRGTWPCMWVRKTANFDGFWFLWFTSTIRCSVTFWEKRRRSSGFSNQVGSPFHAGSRSLNGSRPE